MGAAIIHAQCYEIRPMCSCIELDETNRMSYLTV
jgi:hypothetical protein